MRPSSTYSAPPGDIEAFAGSNHRVRLALDHRRHLVLGLAVRHRHAGSDGDDRLVTDGNRDRQILSPLLGMVEMDGDVVHRDRLDPEPILALHLQPVDAHGLQVLVVPVVRVAADDAGLVDEEAAVAAVEAEHGHQLEQVHVLVDHHSLPGRAVMVLDRSGELLVAADELEELLAQRGILLHAEHQREVRPRAMDVQHHLGLVVALDAVEVECRARLAELGDGSPRTGEIGLEIHFVVDPEELLLGVQQLEEFTKILEGSHAPRSHRSRARTCGHCNKSGPAPPVEALDAGRSPARSSCSPG